MRRDPMRSPFAGALALATVLAFPALGQAPEPDRKALEEKVRALEARQEEATKALAELRASLEASAAAGSPADLKRQLEALEKQQAETRTALEALRAEVSRHAPGPVEAQGLTTKSFPLFGSSGQVSSGTSFNPSISVIPDVVWYRDSENGGASGILAEADGFHGAHAEEGDDHAHGGLSEGFNLRETEIAFSASVDPYFDAYALFSASEEGLEAEEVYVQTRRLPAGLSVKAGKFLSGIGYANAQHPHQWDFVDQNLPYEMLLGDHGLNEKGLQVTWLPKLPFYLRVGAELLQGENERVASYLGPENAGPVPVGEGEEPGEDRVLSYASGPRLFTGFLKVAPDIGYDDALQVGASFTRSTMHQELHDEDGDGIVEEALEGTVDVWGADLVFKHDSPRPYGAGDLALQAEYLWRRKDLDVVGAPGSARFTQDGLYVQAVWGLAPRWQLAARRDVAGLSNEVVEGGEAESWGKATRWSAALTFNPTEFSRIRAQYSRGDAFVDGARTSYDQFFLQVQVSVGAHGAHGF
jgi:chaperonin cofactor prefoldin